MSVVRMNITIPQELARQMDELTKPRKRSQFISEALKHRIDEIQHEKAQKALEEGYKARKEESRFITKEFEVSDLEGWDEY
jgi:metal-responsive CopG/Arc/MetJ family transcriptional regulator